MNSKQRAELRSAANTLEAVFQVGKNGIDSNLLKGIDEVLTARELIKITVHESSEYTSKEVMAILVEQLQAEAVQVIGRKLVIYRLNPKIGKYGI